MNKKKTTFVVRLVFTDDDRKRAFRFSSSCPGSRTRHRRSAALRRLSSSLMTADTSADEAHSLTFETTKNFFLNLSSNTGKASFLQVIQCARTRSAKQFAHKTSGRRVRVSSSGYVRTRSVVSDHVRPEDFKTYFLASSRKKFCLLSQEFAQVQKK